MLIYVILVLQISTENPGVHKIRQQCTVHMRTFPTINRFFDIFGFFGKVHLKLNILAWCFFFSFFYITASVSVGVQRFRYFLFSITYSIPLHCMYVKREWVHFNDSRWKLFFEYFFPYLPAGMAFVGYLAWTFIERWYVCIVHLNIHSML